MLALSEEGKIHLRRFAITRRYIASNPQFRLNDPARPKLSRGQMTIVFGCLERAYRDSKTLDELVQECEKLGYRETFRNKNTDICESILYQLNLIESVEQA